MESITQATIHEKRKHLRIKKKWPITVFKEGMTIEGEVKNITTAGMFISCKEQLRHNEICKISITAPNHRPIDLTCKVVWSNHLGVDNVRNSFGLGISFVSVSDQDLQTLDSLLSKQENRKS